MLVPTESCEFGARLALETAAAHDVRRRLAAAGTIPWAPAKVNVRFFQWEHEHTSERRRVLPLLVRLITSLTIKLRAPKASSQTIIIAENTP